MITCAGEMLRCALHDVLLAPHDSSNAPRCPAP